MSWLSSFLGLDASHNANQAQGQANQLYSQVGAIGQQNANAYNQVPGTINSYAAGVNNNPLLSLFQNGYSNSPLVQALGGAYGLNIPGNQQGSSPTSANGSPVAQASTPNAGTPGATGGQNSILPDNPYSLTQPQQIELNTQLNTLNQAQQQATSAYQASFAERGGSDPQQMAAGVAAIQEQYAALSEQTSGAFAQQALQQRQQGLNELMSGGAQAQAQQNAGNLSVADLLMQLGGQGVGQLETVAGAKQGYSNQQQAQSNADMGSILNLIGTAATGGFGNPFSGSGGSTSSYMPGVDLSQTGW